MGRCRVYNKMHVALGNVGLIWYFIEEKNMYMQETGEKNGRARSPNIAYCRYSPTQCLVSFQLLQL